MKGVVITTADEVSVRDFAAPLNKSLGAVVGGYIELVHPQGLQPPYCMIVNEEGLLKDLPLNRAGSLLYGTQFHGSPSWETSSSWPRNGRRKAGTSSASPKTAPRRWRRNLSKHSS